LGRAPTYEAAPQSSGGNDLVAQLLTRVDALEEQVRQLRGRIDETQNQTQRQGADLNKRIDDLAFQINPNGAGGAAIPPSAGPGQAPNALPAAPPPAAPVKRTPELTLQEGNAALARRDYAAAEAAAREVLSNRTSPRAYDAQLLLAQSLSGQKQYAQAAIAYDDAYNRSRKGPRAQDALLGLASSLSAINEKKASCDTLNRLRTDFPQLRPDIREGMAATSQKAGCR
jgi:TolA-binding protein